MWSLDAEHPICGLWVVEFPEKGGRWFFCELLAWGGPGSQLILRKHRRTWKSLFGSQLRFMPEGWVKIASGLAGSKMS